MASRRTSPGSDRSFRLGGHSHFIDRAWIIGVVRLILSGRLRRTFWFSLKTDRDAVVWIDRYVHVRRDRHRLVDHNRVTLRRFRLAVPLWSNDDNPRWSLDVWLAKGGQNVLYRAHLPGEVTQTSLLRLRQPVKQLRPARLGHTAVAKRAVINYQRRFVARL